MNVTTVPVNVNKFNGDLDVFLPSKLRKIKNTVFIYTRNS